MRGPLPPREGLTPLTKISLPTNRVIRAASGILGAAFVLYLSSELGLWRAQLLSRLSHHDPSALQRKRSHDRRHS